MNWLRLSVFTQESVKKYQTRWWNRKTSSRGHIKITTQNNHPTLALARPWSCPLAGQCNLQDIPDPIFNCARNFTPSLISHLTPPLGSLGPTARLLEPIPPFIAVLFSCCSIAKSCLFAISRTIAHHQSDTNPRTWLLPPVGGQ